MRPPHGAALLKTPIKRCRVHVRLCPCAQGSSASLGPASSTQPGLQQARRAGHPAGWASAASSAAPSAPLLLLLAPPSPPPPVTSVPSRQSYVGSTTPMSSSSSCRQLAAPPSKPLDRSRATASCAAAGSHWRAARPSRPPAHEPSAPSIPGRGNAATVRIRLSGEPSAPPSSSACSSSRISLPPVASSAAACRGSPYASSRPSSGQLHSEGSSCTAQAAPCRAQPALSPPAAAAAAANTGAGRAVSGPRGSRASCRAPRLLLLLRLEPHRRVLRRRARRGPTNRGGSSSACARPYTLPPSAAASCATTCAAMAYCRQGPDRMVRTLQA
ncbi:hypothetical protein TSOC_011829 [Tetrabaena socialis]|uniref:Uncharacterized protein n=1 Tax=Tetrabaena socialis TaxID=47790 RepID=A0A2J7ZPM1_9CHLO|nr:hypothetical protein TSOC_011829 [Tetrabaena socialis]|eukprot:PNH02213.1 hypothetical protein TSOC_011829 [Tetrabaena socialis]